MIGTAASKQTQKTPRQAMPKSGSWRRFSWRKLLWRGGLYALMVIIALVFLIPLFWALATSFKIRSQIITPVIQWIPNPFTLDNYKYVLNNPLLPIAQWFINSLVVAFASTFLILALDSLAAYAYARMQFPGKNAIFAGLLATLFLPGILFLVPNYLTIANLGLLNTYIGVILPGLAGIFGVFFLRQFFQTIPRELEEAALIDGANYFQIFYRIILPLSRPALITLGVISFVASWNDFLWPLLILNDNTMLTLPPGLAQLQAQYNFQFGTMMAGAIVVAAPVLVIYVVLQRYIIRSVATTGLRG